MLKPWAGGYISRSVGPKTVALSEMETAIRWSMRNQQDATRRFLIADVANNRIQYGEVEGVKNNTVLHRTIFQREKLPNFTAFDWSRNEDSLVAIGTSVGECRLISVDPDRASSDVFTLPVKLQRKCNSISFSRGSHLAVGLDRIRGDSSLNIFDVDSQRLEPTRTLTGAEVITNVKFFNDQPQTLVAGSGGVARHGQCLKLFDLRENISATIATVPTRHVHLISLDPLDENYIASAGPSSENVISIWDKRYLASTNSGPNGLPAGSALLELQSVLPQSCQPGVWSLRYSGYRRGAFAVLSAGGLIRLFETNQSSYHDPLQFFVRRSHNLNAYSTPSLVSDRNRAIAFDHASPGGLRKRDSVLTINPSRQLQVLEIPSKPSTVELSNTNEVAFTDESVTMTSSLGSALPFISPSLRDSQSSANERSQITGDLAGLSSRERHEKVLSLRLDRANPNLADALRYMDLQRQRCIQGYLFDCEKNMKIVREDPWLVELWETAKRLKQMSANRGMMHGGLDLSFYGVHDIWFANFEGRAHRLKRSIPTQEEFSRLVKQILASQSYGDFEGVTTSFPERRQLGLAICGWKFDERRLREKCSDIISRKEYYKAIIVAVAHGRKDIAIDLLKTLTRTRVLDNSGLAAVIACSTISDEQRSLCDWMADEAEDPYLKALLAYFVSGTWRTVVDMIELPLQYRVAVALKYLGDDVLGDFLEKHKRNAIEEGDTEGVVLTGLAESASELFQNYIVKFHDLQTAVLALSLTTPHVVAEDRWSMWKTVYFDQMQAWSAFIERTRFINQHNKIVENHRSVTRPAQPRESSSKSNSQLRCSHCAKSIMSKTDNENTPLGTESSTVALKKRDTKPEGTTCHRCAQYFPRCAICMHWQGSARFRQPVASDDAVDLSFTTALIGFCIRCRHSFHVSHAKEWFAQHARCPVPDCSCCCNQGQGLAQRYEGYRSSS